MLCMCFTKSPPHNGQVCIVEGDTAMYRGLVTSDGVGL